MLYHIFESYHIGKDYEVEGPGQGVGEQGCQHMPGLVQSLLTDSAAIYSLQNIIHIVYWLVIIHTYTGCSLNIFKILKNIPDSVSACVHWTSRLDRQMVGRTPALQQNWQSLEKSQLFKEKTQYLLNTMKKVFSKFFTGPEKIVKREALPTSFQQPHISICM